MKRHLASQGVYGGGKPPFGRDVVMAAWSGEQPAAVHAIVNAGMRDAGDGYRMIALRFDMQPRTVTRILDRATRVATAA